MVFELQTISPSPGVGALSFFFFNVWLCWVFAAAQVSLLVAVSRGCSPVVLGLLIAVASLLAKHGL